MYISSESAEHHYLTLSGTKSTVDGEGNQRHNGHQANAPDRGIGLG